MDIHLIILLSFYFIYYFIIILLFHYYFLAETAREQEFFQRRFPDRGVVGRYQDRGSGGTGPGKELSVCDCERRAWRRVVTWRREVGQHYPRRPQTGLASHQRGRSAPGSRGRRRESPAPTLRLKDRRRGQTHIHISIGDEGKIKLRIANLAEVALRCEGRKFWALYVIHLQMQFRNFFCAAMWAYDVHC